MIARPAVRNGRITRLLFSAAGLLDVLVVLFLSFLELAGDPDHFLIAGPLVQEVQRPLDAARDRALEVLALAERAGPLGAALEPRRAVELRRRHAREAVLGGVARDAHQRIELVERALQLRRGGLVVDLVVDAPALDLPDVAAGAVELRGDVVLVQARLADLALLLG